MPHVKWSEVHRRRCGGTREGFGEYATFWPDYEHKCPECGTWFKDGEYQISTETPSGEAWLCDKCAAKIDAEVFQE